MRNGDVPGKVYRYFLDQRDENVLQQVLKIIYESADLLLYLSGNKLQPQEKPE